MLAEGNKEKKIMRQVDVEEEIKQNIGYNPLMDIEANGRNFTITVDNLKNLRFVDNCK